MEEVEEMIGGLFEEDPKEDQPENPNQPEPEIEVVVDVQPVKPTEEAKLDSLMRMMMEQLVERRQDKEERRQDKEELNKKLESLQEGMKEEIREQRKEDREFLKENIELLIINWKATMRP